MKSSKRRIQISVDSFSFLLFLHVLFFLTPLNFSSNHTTKKAGALIERNAAKDSSHGANQRMPHYSSSSATILLLYFLVAWWIALPTWHADFWESFQCIKVRTPARSEEAGFRYANFRHLLKAVFILSQYVLFAFWTPCTEVCPSLRFFAMFGAWFLCSSFSLLIGLEANHFLHQMLCDLLLPNIWRRNFQ